jgi:hypothetical protein
MKSRRMKWDDYGEECRGIGGGGGEWKYTQISVGKLAGKRPLGGPIR